MRLGRAPARRSLRAACGLALGLGACEASPTTPSAAPPVEGGVVDLEGRAVDPLASGAGPTVLVFVSTVCPIANRYAPTLAQLGSEWSGTSVRAWLVYPDPDEDAAAIEAHRSAFDLDWPALRDPAHRLVARAGVTVTPEAAVFAPGEDAPAYRGRIDDRVIAYGNVRAEASRHDLRDAVAAVLDGRAPASPTAPAIGCYISDLR
jgi:hypothetical protein